MVFGQGVGRIWPWYIYEAADVGLMPRVVTTWWGDALPHPHSTVVWALAELGALGVLLVGLLAGTVVRLLTARRWGRPTYLVAAAFVAQLPAWLFDTYLIKNFTLALVWWAVLFSVFGFGSLRDTPASAEDDASADTGDGEPQPSAATAAS